MVDRASGLPPIPIKGKSHMSHLLTLQTSLQCPQEGQGASSLIHIWPTPIGWTSGLTTNSRHRLMIGIITFTVINFRSPCPPPSSQTHTTLCTLHLIVMIALTTLRARFIDHFLSISNSRSLHKDEQSPSQISRIKVEAATTCSIVCMYVQPST